MGDDGFHDKEQLYSRHLSDTTNSPHTICAPLPIRRIAVQHRANDLLVFGIQKSGDNQSELVIRKLRHDGQDLGFEKPKLLLHGTRHHLKFSPNARSLLLVDSSNSKLTVLSPQLIPIRAFDFHHLHQNGEHDHRLTITDDGCTLFTDETSIPLDGSTSVRVGYSNTLYAHSGDARVVLRSQMDPSKTPKTIQCFLREKHLPWPVEHGLETLRELTTWRLEFDNTIQYYQSINRLMQCFHENIHLRDLAQMITRQIPIRDPRALLLLCQDGNDGIGLREYGNSANFSTIFDAITFLEILELAMRDDLHTLPRTGLVELARSERGQALRTLEWGSDAAEQCLKAWFEDPFEIQTEKIGIIRSHKFCWGKDANKGGIFSYPSDKNSKPPTSRKLATIYDARNACFYNLPSNPLAIESQKSQDGVSVMDASCSSRHPHGDKFFKKLIPATIVADCKGAPELKNYQLLDALLKKIIGWMSHPKQKAQKAQLEETRLAMLWAVCSNPSLRYDMPQLLTTRFDGKDSVKDCLAGTWYYRELMKHLGNEEPELEESIKQGRGRGSKKQ